MAAGLTAGSDLPAGWDYNPSSWQQRLPIVALAAVGTLVAGYFAAHMAGLASRGGRVNGSFGGGWRTLLN